MLSDQSLNRISERLQLSRLPSNRRTEAVLLAFQLGLAQLLGLELALELSDTSERVADSLLMLNLLPQLCGLDLLELLLKLERRLIGRGSVGRQGRAGLG